MKNLFKNYSLFNSKVKGFTLAEVLITVGIIGIVATITIPTLVKNYQKKALEAQFNKSISLLNQIIIMPKFNMGIDNIGKYCLSGNYVTHVQCSNEFLMNVIFYNTENKYLHGNEAYPYGVDRTNETIQSYNGENKFTISDAGNVSIVIFYTNRLSDGSYLGFVISGGYTSFAVDINGNKKPNKLGHDIFLFALDNKNSKIIPSHTNNKNITDEMADKIYGDDYTGANKRYYYATYGGPCNRESKRAGNGVGCAYYALINKCPYDNTKTYWECLP